MIKLHKGLAKYKAVMSMWFSIGNTQIHRKNSQAYSNTAVSISQGITTEV